MSTRLHVAVAPFVGVLGLILIVGYLAGRVATPYLAVSPVPVTAISHEETAVPVVRFDRIINGELLGSIRGEARVFLGEELLGVGSGSFRVSAKQLLENIVTVSVPPGMQFVASKRGTYYYPVSSSEGNAIVPENRIYFSDASAAEARGYKARP
ncbi:hypothetical protein HYZ99_02845 [Candidatus Peregrinibacteria bacterium]|nr:hypothetical protein [Candidatus Peregrinibacteria bacterium]